MTADDADRQYPLQRKLTPRKGGELLRLNNRLYPC